ncbi:MAG: hypothetical protein E7284_06640 [Lachnospiraceae bacterium]|nr:hypothetical protein [Lachnospiraceae bacterium]
MKKHIKFVAERIWALRGLLTVFCMIAVLYGVSFVSHADEKGRITASNVNVRESASTTATAVATLSTDDLVDVLAETTGTDNMKWYKITTESGVTGYVRSDFVTKATVTVDVTVTDAKTVYIAGNSANIRQDASTSSARVATAQGGSKVTITGEATGSDGNKWYQISFDANGTTLTGFIRSDLVTTEAPTQDPEVTVIEGGEGNEPEGGTEEIPSEEPGQVPSESEDTQIPVASDTNVLTIMEPASVVEILPVGFEQTELLLNEEVFTVWGRDNFYIMYASVNGGEPQYYLYDTENKSYISYTGLLTEEDVAVPEAEEGLNYKLIAIICIAVIAVLVIVIGILGFKLANAGYRDDEDDDYEDEDDYDDEDEVYVDDEDEDFIDLSDDEEVTVEGATGNIATQIVPEEVSYEFSEAESRNYMDVNPEVSAAENMVYEVQMETPEVYEEQVYTVPTDEGSLDEAAESSYEPEESVLEEDSFEEAFEEEEYEEPNKKRKEKKTKKEKKKLSQRFLDYFTVEVDEEDDDIYEDDDDENDAPVDIEPEINTRSSKYIDEDDDDDLNFIDL